MFRADARLVVSFYFESTDWLTGRVRLKTIQGTCVPVHRTVTLFDAGILVDRILQSYPSLIASQGAIRSAVVHRHRHSSHVCLTPVALGYVFHRRQYFNNREVTIPERSVAQVLYQPFVRAMIEGFPHPEVGDAGRIEFDVI